MSGNKSFDAFIQNSITNGHSLLIEYLENEDHIQTCFDYWESLDHHQLDELNTDQIFGQILAKASRLCSKSEAFKFDVSTVNIDS